LVDATSMMAIDETSTNANVPFMAVDVTSMMAIDEGKKMA
jgi:hypothetical protein